MPDLHQFPDGPGAHDSPDSGKRSLLIYPPHSLPTSSTTSPSSTMSLQYGPVQPEQIRVMPSRSPMSTRPSPITTRSSQSSYHSTSSQLGLQPHALTDGVFPPYPQHIAVFPTGRGAPPLAHSHSQPSYQRQPVPPPMVHSHSQPVAPGAYGSQRRGSYAPESRARTDSFKEYRAHHTEHPDAARERERAYREERYREEREHRRPRTRSLTTAEHRDMATRRQATLIPSDLAEVGHAPTERLARSQSRVESDRGHTRSQSVRGHSSKHGSSDKAHRVQVIVSCFA